MEVNPLQLDGETEEISRNFLDFIALKGEMSETWKSLKNWTPQPLNAAIFTLETLKSAESPSNVSRKLLNVDVFHQKTEDIVVAEANSMLSGVVDYQGVRVTIVDDIPQLTWVTITECPGDVLEVTIDPQGWRWSCQSSDENYEL